MPISLRRAVDAVCALSAAGLIAGVLYFSNQDIRERQVVTGVADELARFRAVLTTHAAARDASVNLRGWPKSIDPTWFGSDPPRNALVTPDRPWVEIATAEESTFSDPPVRMTINSQLASFWYNPYQGIIKARVPVSINDRRSLDLYNRINGTNLDSIYSATVPAPVPIEPPADAPTTTTADATPPAEPDLDPTKPLPPAPKP